jgi:glucosamine 6-phosphate synthetase-like amidotransferase/phosphosugar isomerase protein
MCGLIGVIPADNFDININNLNSLIEISRKRGLHATGYFAFSSPSNYVLRKESGHQLYIPDHEPFRKASLILAHVRKATKGSWLDNAANHPHQVGNLVLIHNGTVNGIQNLARKHNLDNIASNDSYAIVALINYMCYKYKIPLEESIELVMSNADTTDSYAVVLFDIKNSNLYLFRNASKPLYILATQEVMAFCSDKEYFDGLFTTKNKFFGFNVNSIIDIKPKEVIKICLKDKVAETILDIPVHPLLWPEETQSTENTTKTVLPLPAIPKTIPFMRMQNGKPVADPLNGVCAKDSEHYEEY